MHPDTLTQHFFQLHQGALRLPNAWDAASARWLEAGGAPAIATSSAAFAWSLGYPDGSTLPAEELLGAVQRIRRAVRVPVSIDLEAGYSDAPEAVAALVAQVQALGVNGINLEDGEADPALLVAKLQAIRTRLGGAPLFINARCDLALRALVPEAELASAAIERGQRYREAGADGLFLPGCLNPAVVRSVAEALPMPLNLMLPPGDAREPELLAAGARRLSCGPALLLRALAHVAEQGAPWLPQRQAMPQDFSGVNALF